MRNLLSAMVLVAFICLPVFGQGIGVNYSDKIVWRGFELSDESDAIAPQINIDVNGIEISARGLLVEEKDYEDIDNWDIQISFKKNLDPFEVTTGFGYFDYPDTNIKFRELWAQVGLPIGPATPRYSLVRAQNEGGSDGGWLHILGLDLSLTEKAELFAETVFNDGFTPFGSGINSDWSHLTAGASLEIPIAERVSMKSSVYYQRTFDRPVNSEHDQVWYSAGIVSNF